MINLTSFGGDPLIMINLIFYPTFEMKLSRLFREEKEKLLILLGCEVSAMIMASRITSPPCSPPPTSMLSYVILYN